jgi:DNA-binding transcriptional MerR regulator
MSMFKQDMSAAQKVVALRRQGLSDNQIIQTLQQEGIPSEQVLEALEMADNQFTPAPMQGAPVQNPMQQQPRSVNPRQNQTDTDVEELIEAIIEEKWQDVEKDISRVLEWKDTVDERITTLSTELKRLGKNFDDLHKALLGKVEDYDKNILNVGVQLKAMEEAFSKVLPVFTNNVQELDRITTRMRRE